MYKQLSIEQVQQEISVAVKALQEPDMRAIHLWERMHVKPELWMQGQYSGQGDFWVVAVIGNRCLYFNHIEYGWGWGRYEKWGKVSEYHWQDLSIHHVVFQTLFAIDNGGAG